MNQSEIAEKAAREIQSSCLGIDDEMGIVIFESEKAKAIVERAIAESQVWISVEEKLPPAGEPVLFGWWNLPRNSVVSHYCCEIGMHRAEERYWEAERTAPQDEPIRFSDNSGQVTHWMPLPKPPKGTENV